MNVVLDDPQNTNQDAVSNDVNSVTSIQDPMSLPPSPPPDTSFGGENSPFPKSESLPYTERSPKPEVEKSMEVAPKPVAPKPKSLEEVTDIIPEELPKSTGRVLDKRTSVQDTASVEISTQDPITAYADSEEDTFIKGVKTSHDDGKL